MNRKNRFQKTRIAIVVALVFTSVALIGAPAQATTTAITGTQNWGSTVYWATERHTSNQTWHGQVNFNSLSCDDVSMVYGIRDTSGVLASFAKTPSMYPGYGAAFVDLATGGTTQTLDNFWMTTYLSGGASCPNTTGATWNSTLIWNLAG
jgi:hypothetical protein